MKTNNFKWCGYVILLFLFWSKVETNLIEKFLMSFSILLLSKEKLQ